MTLTQEDYNSMMRDIGDRPTKTKNNLPACPKCGERYLGDGVSLCIECEAELSATSKIGLYDAYQCDDCGEKHMAPGAAMECCGLPHYTTNDAFFCPMCGENAEDINDLRGHACKELEK